MLGKRGRSQRALWQWWVQKGGILRETRSLERQTMLGGRDRWEGWSLSRYWLTFPLRLKTQLSVDKTKSRHCLINVEKGKRSGCWKIDWGLRQWEKTKKCLMLRWLCYEVGRRFKEKVSSEWKKSSGSFTAYQDVIYQSSLRRPQWWALHCQVSTGWHGTKILNSTCFSSRFFRTYLLPTVNRMENPGE